MKLLRFILFLCLKANKSHITDLYICITQWHTHTQRKNRTSYSTIRCRLSGNAYQYSNLLHDVMSFLTFNILFFLRFVFYRHFCTQFDVDKWQFYIKPLHCKLLIWWFDIFPLFFCNQMVWSPLFGQELSSRSRKKVIHSSIIANCEYWYTFGDFQKMKLWPAFHCFFFSKRDRTLVWSVGEKLIKTFISVLS